MSADGEVLPYDKNSWGTPVHIIEAVREAFGGTIDCDPASNAKAQERVRALEWYGEGSPNCCAAISEDGLEYAWRGKVFLNPPYGKGLLQPFADHLVYEWSDETRTKMREADWVVKAHAVLVNLDPSTQWFKTIESCSSHLVNLGRVRFLHPDTGLPLGVQQRSSCLLVGGDVNLEPLRKLGSVYARA